MKARVVLDSNVVLSALLFTEGRLSWMRRAWQQGRFTPLASRATLDELVRVLAYPKFRLDAADVMAVLSDYLPFVETVAVVPAAGAAAAAPDRDDRKFLELAIVGEATLAVTGDRAVLDVEHAGGVRVVTPSTFRALLEGGQVRGADVR